MTITDMTQTNLITLRRTIYLTIMSSLDFEECAHKLLKMTLQPGMEVRAASCSALIHLLTFIDLTLTPFSLTLSLAIFSTPFPLPSPLC